MEAGFVVYGETVLRKERETQTDKERYKERATKIERYMDSHGEAQSPPFGINLSENEWMIKLSANVLLFYLLL